MKDDKTKLFEGARKRREEAMAKILKSEKVQGALRAGRDAARREVSQATKKKA